MKRNVAFISTILLVLIIVGVAYARHELMIVPTQQLAFGHKTTMPMPQGGDLRQYIIGQEPYKNWKMWPGKEAFHKGTEPHGALLTVYVNDIALDSLSTRKGMGNNSIILKENYTPDKKLAAITVMYKVKGYNAEAGDWFWVKYDFDFNIQKEGKVAGCISCHSKASDNDYIFTGKIK
ncbi:MAG: cytochrome P460 family protein [Nitrospiraceae bacterium]|nr:MAG: cytochrome P460 family protein [Nitrospiraceae bacterium]